MHVSVAGYSDGATTDPWGDFELLAHAPEGQMITIRAEKDARVAQVTVPAGTTVDLTLKQK